ncbi:disintegrin and metalloproteinase domain-containing protein 10-like [Amblyomma americanum]
MAKEQVEGRVPGGIMAEFRLQLVQDRSAFSEDFSMVTSRGRVQATLDHIYSGHVAGSPGSRVVGAVLDGVFTGRISLSPDGDRDFYVERAASYLLAPFHSVIYAAQDVSFDGAGCGLEQMRRRRVRTPDTCVVEVSPPVA